MKATDKSLLLLRWRLSSVRSAIRGHMAANVEMSAAERDQETEAAAEAWEAELQRLQAEQSDLIARIGELEIVLPAHGKEGTA